MDGSAQQLETTARPGRARQVATAAVLVALVVSAFEGTVVTTAMPTITLALGGRALYAWVFSAFLLASTLGVMLSGKLADQLGRKPVFVGGVALFVLGSLLCGLAPSMGALIAFRALQGLGAGVIQPTTMTISADLYTLKERAAVQSVFTGGWGLASVMGPVLGGWIVGHSSWRWVFLVNVPVAALSAALLIPSYRDPPRRKVQPELAGPLLGGATAALMLLTLEPAVSSWLRGLSAIAALSAGAIFWRQQRRATEPVVPLAHLGDRTVQAGLLGGAFAGALLYATSAYVPLWMTSSGHGALSAGLALVPMLGAWAIGSSLGVKVLLRGGMRASVGGGLVVCAVGAVGMALCAGANAGLGAIFLALAIFGLGMGPTASTSTLGPQSVVPWRARGMVTSAVYAARMLGGAVAISLLDLCQGHPARQVMLIAPVAVLGACSLLALAPREKPRSPGVAVEALPALD